MSTVSNALVDGEASPAPTDADPSGAAIAALRSVIGSAVTVDPAVVESYRRDQSKLTSAGSPLCVVRARSIDDVRATMQWAHARRIPVVTRGAGSGLAGGANAVDGCVILSLAGLDQIIHIDVASKLATVQAGVVNADLARAAAASGLWYPPDPGSRDFSTIGGNVATNAGGSCCVKYGVTADHVARIKAVLPDGRVIHTGSRTRKNVAGLDIGSLLVGSEGTLAVIVEVTVRLRRAPGAMSTVVASFPDCASAIDAVIECAAVADPCVMEVMDRTTIRAVESMTRMGLDVESGALLLIRCDGADFAADAERCAAVCRRTAGEVWSTDDAEEGEAMMAARRMALPALERSGGVLLDDVAVPVPQLPGMMQSIDRIAERYDIRIGTFGHAGDGNLHPTIMFDETDPSQVSRAGQAFEAIVERAVELGGTIAGEHGVGVLKRAHLRLMIGDAELDLQSRIRQAFDPYKILNPGKG
ncbi:D-lactate dehydrogenase (cytochrome)/glycolate oxidase [Gordonia hydrophobica]|nr:D-lactate dehydrogenase (cytochrome)/glycolate oxidase [Gordonia hydrophobica]